MRNGWPIGNIKYFLPLEIFFWLGYTRKQLFRHSLVSSADLSCFTLNFIASQDFHICLYSLLVFKVMTTGSLTLWSPLFPERTFSYFWSFQLTVPSLWMLIPRYSGASFPHSLLTRTLSPSQKHLFWKLHLKWKPISPQNST